MCTMGNIYEDDGDNQNPLDSIQEINNAANDMKNIHQNYNNLKGLFSQNDGADTNDDFSKALANNSFNEDDRPVPSSESRGNSLNNYRDPNRMSNPSTDKNTHSSGHSVANSTLSQGKDAVKNNMENAAKESSEKAAKKGMEEAASKTAEAAASAGAAAATGGISEAVKIAAKAGKAVVNAIANMNNEKADRKGSPLKTFIICTLIAIFIIPTLLLSMAPKITTYMAVESYTSVAYEMEENDNVVIKGIGHVMKYGIKLIQNIKNMFDDDEPLLGFSSKDASEKEPLDEYSFNEYNDSATVVMDALDEIFPKAYDLAVKEAYTYCRDNNINWKKSKATLKDNDCDTWEKVYDGVNYADLISALCIALYGMDVSDFDSKEFEAYIKKQTTYKKFYYISYEAKFDNTTPDYKTKKDKNVADNNYDIDNEDDENVYLNKDEEALYQEALSRYNEDIKQGRDATKPTRASYCYHAASYIDINIHSYCLVDLYSLTQKNRFDKYENDATIDIESMHQEVMVPQLEALVTGDVLERLKGDGSTPWDQLTRDNEKVLSLENIISDYTLEEDHSISISGDFDTNEWYTDVPVSASSGGGHCVNVQAGWAPIYDGPTCTANSNSYYVNFQKVKSDVFAKFSEITGVQGNVSSWSSYEFGSYRHSYQGVTWELNSGGAATKNGRILIACGPGVVIRDYYANTGGVGNPRSAYEYGSKQMDLVLQSKTNGNTYYIPVTTGDSKAHTFYSGIIQSGIAIPGSASEQISASNGISDHAIVGLGTAQDAASVIRNYNSMMPMNGFSSVYTWAAHGAVEWCYIGSNPGVKKLDFEVNYDLLGIIVY